MYGDIHAKLLTMGIEFHCKLMAGAMLTKTYFMQSTKGLYS